jgi:hypothetical protein
LKNQLEGQKLSANASGQLQRHELRTVVVAVTLFAAVFNVMFFTSSGTGLLYLYLAITAAFAFGFCIGFRVSGKSSRYYFLVGLLLAVLTWVMVLAGFTYYDIQFNPLVSFVRICAFATLLCTGGALLGDMAKRRKMTINKALLATITAVAGAVAGIVAIFK